MNREEITLLGFEIVAYAGDACSKLLEVFKTAKNGDFVKVDSPVIETGSYIAEAYNSQAATLVRKASGEELPYSATMIYGQDHLMTTVLLEDVIHRLIELYKRGVE